jgi:hypothetical protein
MTGDALVSTSRVSTSRKGAWGSPDPSSDHRGRIEHRLKSWPQFFERIVSGEKTHELRRADRDFRVGDILRLREFDPQTNQFTGREHSVIISYITSAELPCAASQDALHPDFCVLSIKQP